MAHVACVLGPRQFREQLAAGLLRRLQHLVGPLVVDRDWVDPAGVVSAARGGHREGPSTEHALRVPEVAHLRGLREHGACSGSVRYPGSGRIRHRHQPSLFRWDTGLGWLRDHRPRHLHLPSGTLLGCSLLGGVHLRADKHYERVLLCELERVAHRHWRSCQGLGPTHHEELCRNAGGGHHRCCDYAAQPILALRTCALAKDRAHFPQEGQRGDQL
mmetsp:Transcript_81595/g.174867  ORF Transcript_81595/g.174867 Transcript_81595/m.174867 type:complete len:216 (-) Transcript_81595:973-1620(-)